MEDGNNSFCSQVFFVSQRVRSNNLSLSSKTKKTSKLAPGDSLMNQKISQGTLDTAVEADKVVRSGTLGSNLTKMEKYFGKLSSNSNSSLKEPADGDSGSETASSLEDKTTDKYANCKPNRRLCLKEISHSSSGVMSTERTFKNEFDQKSDHLISVHIPNDGCSDDVADCFVSNVIPVDGKEEEEDAEKCASLDALASKTGDTNILLCPLCFKLFDSKDAQFSHMKLCAGKNKVSTKQLLDALELVQRQEAERKALGLPLIVNKIPKKPKKVSSLVSSIRPKNALEGSIHLGLALSASLEESEKQKERDHLLEAGLFSEAEEKGLLSNQGIEEIEPLPTAPIFLNVGHKSSVCGLDVPKTSKKNSKLFLNGKIPKIFTRTTEEREQLITEKVAIILVSDNINRDNNVNLYGDKNCNRLRIISVDLKKHINKENIWWKMASFSSPSESDDKYYVGCFSHLIPFKVNAEKKLRDLPYAQVQKTPDKSSTIYLSDSMIKAKWKSPSPAVPSCSSKEDIDKASDKKPIKKALFGKSSEPTEINSLSRDWSKLVGRKQMSDIIVYTKDDHEIPAHRLVFYVRCPEVLKELVEVKSKGEQLSYMLMWTETCYVAAMKFLRFVYTDIFIDTATLGENELEDLKNLSNRYDVKDLASLLNKIPYSSDLHEIKSNSCPYDVIGNIFEKNNAQNHESSGGKGSNEEAKKCLNLVSSDGDAARNESSSIHNEMGRCSPDIFEAIDAMNSPASVEIIDEKMNKSEFDKMSQDSRESIEYLVSLMEDSSFNQSDNADQQITQTTELIKYSNSAASDQNSRFIPEKNDSCETVNEPSTPKTPSYVNISEYLVYSTPAPEKSIGSTNFDGLFKEKKIVTSCDMKRKSKSSEDSEMSPIPKKVCIIDDKDEDDKEVVDLVLSESEEVGEKFTINTSETSTLPAPENGICPLSPVIQKINSSIESQCNASYISNVWDDFDYISEPHHVDVFSSPNESPKRSSTGTENLNSEAVLNCDGKISDLPENILSASSSKFVNSSEKTVTKDDTEELYPSPIKSVQVSPVKEDDITQQLLTTSLQEIDNSLYWRDENEPSLQSKKSSTLSPCQTPVKIPSYASSSKSRTPVNPIRGNVTPLADYSAMKTPLLHKELDRYGIKHLKRNQAKLLLRHIYNELHPVVSEESNEAKKTSNVPDLSDNNKIKNQAKENKATNKKKITFRSLDSSSEVSSSEESSDGSSESVILEESIYEPQFESPVKSQSLSQRATCVDIPTAMKNLVESNPDIHKKILLYEPIWLNDMKMALKENGARFNTNQLMNYLDEQCITFRIAQGNRHHKRRKKSKKTFSLSQPCDRRKNSDQSISSSQPF